MRQGVVDWVKMDEQRIIEGGFPFFVIYFQRFADIKQGTRHCYLFMNVYRSTVPFLGKNYMSV
jgi:hypothetical protein